MITVYRLLAALVFILLWWAASFTSQFIPTPLQTAVAAKTMFSDGVIYKSIGETVSVYLTGYLLGVLVALPVGLLMGGFRILGRTLEIYVNALMATPRVAFIPLIIVLLGLGFQAKIAVIFLGTVMPILINTYAGVLNADGELVEMARSTGARRSQIFLKILFPGALPFVVVGLRLGATIGLINTIVAELYTAVRGLGGLLALYGNTFQMERYFVVVFVLATLGVIVTQLLRVLESRMEGWRYKG